MRAVTKVFPHIRSCTCNKQSSSHVLSPSFFFLFLLDPKTDPVGPLPNKGGHGTNDKVGDNLQHRTVPKHDTESHGALQQISAHCIKISDAYGVNNDKADEMRCQLLFERNRAAAPDVRSPT